MGASSKQEPPAGEASATPVAPTATRRIASRELFRGAREVLIDHQGQQYRLRWTRKDKLILNK